MEKEKYLVVNAGSSSLKFSLYEMPAQEELVNVYVEKIGSKDCFWTLKMNGEKIKKELELKDHEQAVRILTEELVNYNVVKDLTEIKALLPKPTKMTEEDKRDATLSKVVDLIIDKCQQRICHCIQDTGSCQDRSDCGC